MLSKTRMVKAKALIEKKYDGTCKIISSEGVIDENHITHFEDKVVAENVPCHLSFNSKTEAKEIEGYYKATQVPKLFVNPELTILPGSKIEVTQNGITQNYSASGLPAVYPTHQEIILVIAEVV
ncbi:MAG: hypothetical protein RSA49_00075 [Anaerovoracaceae bacterium]